MGRQPYWIVPNKRIHVHVCEWVYIIGGGVIGVACKVNKVECIVFVCI
jgi:hypothetical protein